MKTTLTNHPLTADLSDLTACLSLLGPRPLKLVADKVCPQFGETRWVKPKWSFTRKAGSVVSKALLPYAADTFQFSLAGKESKQDYHRHKAVFEIYASTLPLKVRYAGRKLMRVRSGVLMIPPGVWHQVKLDGPTFVFQAVCGKATVHADKEIRPKSR